MSDAGGGRGGGGGGGGGGDRRGSKSDHPSAPKRYRLLSACASRTAFLPPHPAGNAKASSLAATRGTAGASLPAPVSNSFAAAPAALPTRQVNGGKSAEGNGGSGGGGPSAAVGANSSKIYREVTEATKLAASKEGLAALHGYAQCALKLMTEARRLERARTIPPGEASSEDLWAAAAGYWKQKASKSADNLEEYLVSAAPQAGRRVLDARLLHAPAAGQGERKGTQLPPHSCHQRRLPPAAAATSCVPARQRPTAALASHSRHLRLLIDAPPTRLL